MCAFAVSRMRRCVQGSGTCAWYSELALAHPRHRIELGHRFEGGQDKNGYLSLCLRESGRNTGVVQRQRYPAVTGSVFGACFTAHVALPRWILLDALASAGYSASKFHGVPPSELIPLRIFASAAT
jgi:hypothetical protein